MSAVPKVTIRSRGWITIVPVLVGLLIVFWAVRHVMVLSDVYLKGDRDHHLVFETAWAISFLFIAFQLVLAWIEPVYTLTPRQAEIVDAFKVTVNVPVYNEDPVCLERCLMSVFSQTRLPDHVSVVDDGSDSLDYTEIRDRFYAAGDAAGIKVSWHRQDNAGKRHAQAVTFRNDDADIYVTLDSDTILDDHAIEEGLKPFARPNISSVAGLYLGLNAEKNWLTRVAELVCVSWQLQGRSASSTMGNVLVNSGAFALYRGWIFRKYLDAYLGETFFGRSVPFSDDAHMTMFSLMHGKTVQQRTATSMTLYPEKFGNYCRQYTRWMRGAFIRMWWRFKYLPLRSFAFWNELLGQSQFILACGIFVSVYVYWPTIDHRVWPYTIIIPLALGYVVTGRYLMVKRSDVSTASMWLTYSMAPLMILWSWFVCRPIKIYAAITWWRIGWGTRQNGIEVGLNADFDLVNS